MAELSQRRHSRRNGGREADARESRTSSMASNIPRQSIRRTAIGLSTDQALDTPYSLERRRRWAMATPRLSATCATMLSTVAARLRYRKRCYDRTASLLIHADGL